jgi:hypothetical protein
LDLAELEQAVRLGLGRGFADEREVAARAQRGDERAGEEALVGSANRGGQVLGIGVDREAVLSRKQSMILLLPSAQSSSLSRQQHSCSMQPRLHTNSTT